MLACNFGPKLSWVQKSGTATCNRSVTKCIAHEPIAAAQGIGGCHMLSTPSRYPDLCLDRGLACWLRFARVKTLLNCYAFQL